MLTNLNLNLKKFHMENPRNSTKKLLELIREFSKVTGYKVNVQKSIAFLCTNNEAAEREIKKTVPFTILPKIIRYLGINLTKEVKDLYSKNSETLMKGIQDNAKKWEDTPCPWVGRTNIVKMSILLGTRGWLSLLSISLQLRL